MRPRSPKPCSGQLPNAARLRRHHVTSNRSSRSSTAGVPSPPEAENTSSRGSPGPTRAARQIPRQVSTAGRRTLQCRTALPLTAPSPSSAAEERSPPRREKPQEAVTTSLTRTDNRALSQLLAPLHECMANSRLTRRLASGLAPGRPMADTPRRRLRRGPGPSGRPRLPPTRRHFQHEAAPRGATQHATADRLVRFATPLARQCVRVARCHGARRNRHRRYSA